MEGNFELNKSGWYEVQFCIENEFLNAKLDSDQYGKWYSVQFSGNAETYLWQTKTSPVEGEKYWGYLETTKSGKSTKFKWDKQNAPDNTPDGKPSTQTQERTNTSHSITLGMVWKTVAGIRGLPENDEQFAKFFEIVDAHLKELLSMSDKINK